MKILMVLERDFPPDIRVEHEIETLLKAGHDVHLASFTRKESPEFENWKGAVIHRKPISSFMYKTSVGCLKYPFYFNFWRSFLSKLQERYQYDAVHIHDLPLAQLGVELKEKYKIRFILDLHENWPALLEVSNHVKSLLGRILSSDEQWREYEKEMVNQADDVIVVVEENKQRMSGFINDPEKIHIVSNTPTSEDLDLILNHSVSPISDSGNMILFYGGGVTEHRGLQDFLMALSELKDLNIKFWVVGDGSYLQDLKQMANELKVEDKIIFWGWKNLEEMMNLMHEANVLLIPHYKSAHTDTTIPHKLFQYMATGKPILATNCRPIERVINETEAGIIYEFNNQKSLISSLLKLYSNWKGKKVGQTEGINFIKSKYNWTFDGRNLINIYSSNEATTL